MMVVEDGTSVVEDIAAILTSLSVSACWSLSRDRWLFSNSWAGRSLMSSDKR